MADDIIKQSKSFREQMVAEFDKFFEIAADIQQQLQVQERSKGKEIGEDFSFANPQLDNLPCLPLSRPQKIEVESEILPPNQQTSLMSNDSSDSQFESQLESEGFVELLNHAPITTTEAKLQFEESKSEVLANLQPEESISEFEVLPNSAAIESSKNNDVRKMFDELTKRDLNPLKAVSVFVNLRKEIYISMEDNIVKNEPTDATLVVRFEMKSIDNIMGFDPGGGHVFDESSPEKIYAFQYFDSHGMSFIAKPFFLEQKMNVTSVAHTCNDAIFSFQFVGLGETKFHSPYQSQPMEPASFLSMHQAAKFLYHETIHHWILEEWADESDAFQQNGRMQKHQHLCAELESLRLWWLDSMFDQPSSKPPPQFRHLSREDTTHSRGEYCYGNGRVWVWRFVRRGAIAGAKVGVEKPLD